MQQKATFTVSVVSSGPVLLVLNPAGGALPEETVGTAVADLVTNVSGGRAPYNFEISAGAVPDGLDLMAEDQTDGSQDITLEGTPTTEGDFSFDLTVTDADGVTATASAKGAAKKKVVTRRR